MLLPYFLDLIPERLGVLFGKLTGWRPEHKRVLLAIDESGDSSLKDKVIPGTILSVKLDKFGKPSDAVFKPDSPLVYKEKSNSYLLLSPRFNGHGLYRLLITWSVVHIFAINNPEIANEMMREDMIAIGLLKLENRKHVRR
jgi:hypothetical protein